MAFLWFWNVIAGSLSSAIRWRSLDFVYTTGILNVTILNGLQALEPQKLG